MQLVGESIQDEHGGLHFYIHFPFDRVNYPRQAVHSVAVHVLHPLEHATHVSLESKNPSAQAAHLVSYGHLEHPAMGH